MSTYFSSEFKETPNVSTITSKFNYCLRSGKVEKVESKQELEQKQAELTSNHLKYNFNQPNTSNTLFKKQFKEPDH